jgi:K+-transporting ATPase c subunit
MFRLSRTSVIAWTAVVAVIAALSYALTVVAVPHAAAEDKASATLVEFTADGKLKKSAIASGCTSARP